MGWLGSPSLYEMTLAKPFVTVEMAFATMNNNMLNNYVGKTKNHSYEPFSLHSYAYVVIVTIPCCSKMISSKIQDVLKSLNKIQNFI